MNTRKVINCPACGHVLSKIKTGKIMVDACVDGCGGVWFDALELAEVNEPDETAGKALLNISKNPAIVVDKAKERFCPVCNVPFFSYNVTMGAGFVIDECPQCNGFWLDDGELAVLRGDSGIANERAFNSVEYQSAQSEKQRPVLERVIRFFTGE